MMQTMTPDPRHLRARWTIAAVGWLLWAVAIALPFPIVPRAAYQIYPEVLHELSNPEWYTVNNRKDLLGLATLICFCLATAVFAASPVLVALNHGLRAKVRRWRWVGLGLLPAAQLSALLLSLPGRAEVWPVHLLVLSHLILLVAIVPWPRERIPNASGFEVVMPGERERG